MTDPFPDSTLTKMAQNALDATLLPPLPSPLPGAVRFVLVAEVFPEQGNALVASASTMATVAPTEDWLQAAVKHLRDGVCGYIQDFRYNETWHKLNGKEKKQ